MSKHNYYSRPTLEQDMSFDDVVLGCLLGGALLGLLGSLEMTLFCGFGLYVRALAHNFARPAWDSLSDLKRR